MATTAQDPTYMTVHEVASLFRMHPETIRDWVRRGKLRGTFMGKKWLFERAYIRRELAKRTRDDHAAVARMAAGV